MMSSHRRGLRPAAASAALLVGLAACGQSAAEGGGAAGTGAEGDSDTLVVASIPSENSGDLEQSFGPLVDMLAEETGKKVEFQTATDYAAIIEGQRAGTIDIAQYGPFSYVLAKDTGVPVEAVGVQAEGPGTEPSYRSYAVAKPDSGITDLSDLKGKTVCFVDQNSTSGYLYPTAGLRDAGLKEGDYEEVFAGGHDASALAVRDGDCDAGFVYDTMFTETLPQQGELEKGQLEKFWESDAIGNSPLAVSTDLSADLRKQIETAVLEKGNADALGVEDIGGYWGYVGVEEGFFDPVRKVCESTQAEACQAAG